MVMCACVCVCVCVRVCVSKQVPYTDLPPHESEPDLCIQSMMPIQAG